MTAPKPVQVFRIRSGASETDSVGSSVKLSAGLSDTMTGGDVLIGGGDSNKDGGGVSLQTKTSTFSGAISVSTSHVKGESGGIRPSPVQ